MSKNQASAATTASAQVTKVSEICKNEKTVIPVVINTAKKEAETAPETGRKSLSLDELTEKAEKLNLLRVKLEDIKDKRKQLQAFQISHDEKNAQLTIVDATGQKISTSSPTSIGQVIDIWGSELDAHLSNVEKSMRAILEAF